MATWDADPDLTQFGEGLPSLSVQDARWLIKARLDKLSKGGNGGKQNWQNAYLAEKIAELLPENLMNTKAIGAISLLPLVQQVATDMEGATGALEVTRAKGDQEQYGSVSVDAASVVKQAQSLAGRLDKDLIQGLSDIGRDQMGLTGDALNRWVTDQRAALTVPGRISSEVSAEQFQSRLDQAAQAGVVVDPVTAWDKAFGETGDLDALSLLTDADVRNFISTNDDVWTAIRNDVRARELARQEGIVTGPGPSVVMDVGTAYQVPMWGPGQAPASGAQMGLLDAVEEISRMTPVELRTAQERMEKAGYFDDIGPFKLGIVDRNTRAAWERVVLDSVYAQRPITETISLAMDSKEAERAKAEAEILAQAKADAVPDRVTFAAAANKLGQEVLGRELTATELASFRQFMVGLDTAKMRVDPTAEGYRVAGGLSEGAWDANARQYLTDYAPDEAADLEALAQASDLARWTGHGLKLPEMNADQIAGWSQLGAAQGWTPERMFGAVLRLGVDGYRRVSSPDIFVDEMIQGV